MASARITTLQSHLKDALSGFSIGDDVLAGVAQDLTETLDLFGGCHEGCKPGCKAGCTDGCQNVSKG